MAGVWVVVGANIFGYFPFNTYFPDTKKGLYLEYSPCACR